MSAVLLTGHGGIDKLVYRDDVPVPLPGPRDVLVRIDAAGVNNTDINMREGWYSKAGAATGSVGEAASVSEYAGWTGQPVRFPLIQGADVCGRVVGVGSHVAATRIGERVLVDPVLRGDRAGPGVTTRYLGSDCDGGFAQYVCVPAGNAHLVRSSLSDAELACLPCSYSAAENMLLRADVRAGDIVLVTGASGGVGSAAVQLARHRGAQVVALAGASKAAQVGALGAARVLPRDADLVAALGKESMDVVIDVVGGRQFPAFLEVLRRGCRYAVAGAIDGPLVELDLRTLYLKDLRLIGCTIPDPIVFENLVRYVEAGEIRPLVSRTFALREIAAAQREFLTKRHVGKIVLIAEHPVVPAPSRG
jgi:NADPH:quinone reductase-like Zn-dependent oxidoreductase